MKNKPKNTWVTKYDEIWIQVDFGEIKHFTDILNVCCFNVYEINPMLRHNESLSSDFVNRQLQNFYISISKCQF